MNEVVDPDQLMPRALEIADRLVKNAPLALRAVKEAVIRTSGVELEEVYRIEHEFSARLTSSADAREGPRALVARGLFPRFREQRMRRRFRYLV